MSVLCVPLLRERVVTASVLAPPARAPDTARVLVTRHYPQNASHGFFHEWWDHLAPSRDLAQAYRCGGIGWNEFAYQYLVALEADPRWWVWVAEDVARLLCRYETVCLIGTTTPQAGDEMRARCHRRLVWAWLVGADVAFTA